MSGATRTVVREPSVDSPRHYGQRVHRLAAIYVALFCGALAGLALLIWRGKFFVDLSQRSNVETLALAFFFIFFLYVAVLSRKGVAGAMRIAYYGLLARATRDRAAAERRKHEALPAANDRPFVALNVVLQRRNKPGDAFELAVSDDAGSLGFLRIDGARVTYLPSKQSGSNSIFAFFEQEVNRVLRERGVDAEVDIVDWQTIDDEATQQYLGLVQFARNLERHLGGSEFWPTLALTQADCRELESCLSAICPALRDEGFLPDWEYTAEHKLPIVPEPLGLASLSRSERRADPLTTMGFAAAVVITAVGILGLLILFPPWVPGT